MGDSDLSSGRDASRFVGGFIVGGIVGSLLTLVALGSKDEKLKREVRKKVRELVKDLPKFMEDLEEKGEKVVVQVSKALPSGKKKTAR